MFVLPGLGTLVGIAFGDLLGGLLGGISGFILGSRIFISDLYFGLLGMMGEILGDLVKSR